MLQPMDDAARRTMFVGLFLGMAFYGLGLAARAWLPEPYNFTAWFALTLLGLVVLIGWFLAVRRGFRVRWLGRAKGKRAKGRKVRDRFMGQRVRRP